LLDVTRLACPRYRQGPVMMSFYAVSGLLGLVAFPAAILLAGLTVRNPRAPAWLRTEGVATGAVLLLTAVTVVAIMHALSALATADVAYPVIAILVAGIPSASAVLLWKAFGVGDRLARADAGGSPFRPDRTAPGAQDTGKQAAEPA
jgi:hypothetical protein